MAHSDIAAIEHQQHVYESLSRYFSEHEHEVIEIEILPPAIQPPDGILMQDGSSLGVSKKALALAFLAARQIFFDNKSNHPLDPKVQKSPTHDELLTAFIENFISLADPQVRPSKQPRPCYYLIQSI